jgi:hypothetical protein
MVATGIAAAQSPGKYDSVYLNVKVPGVYMTFERLGKRVPLREGESDQGWFLTIHNNYRWSLRFTALGDIPKQNGDADLVYDVIEDPHGYPPSPIPSGNWFDVVSTEVLQSGRTLLFSVPKANLNEGLGIRIEFNYEWEAGRPIQPVHHITFCHSELPARFRKGEKRRPGWMEGGTVGSPATPMPSPLPTTLTIPTAPEVTPRKK